MVSILISYPLFLSYRFKSKARKEKRILIVTENMHVSLRCDKIHEQNSPTSILNGNHFFSFWLFVLLFLFKMKV